MPDVRVRRQGEVVLVSEADLRVLNGLDIEIERGRRDAEALENPNAATLGYHLSQGRRSDKLSHYHPAKAFARRSLLQLERAGLTKRKRDRYGIAWHVTAAGDALLEERTDDLPRAICEGCWDEEVAPPVDVEPRPDVYAVPDLPELCPTCIYSALERAEQVYAESAEQARQTQERIAAYASEVMDALDSAE